MAKKKKWFIWIIIILLVVGGIGWQMTKKPKTEYLTQLVKKETISQTVSVTGDLIARDEVQLNFQRSGKITQLLAEVGDKVETGKVLGAIDDNTIRSQIRQANADIVYQRELYENMKKNRDLYTKDQRQAQKVLVERSEITRNGVALLLKEAVVRTPITGTVTKRNAEVGEVANLSVPVFVVAGDTGIVIKANIPESDILAVKVDQRATVAFDALSEDETFSARVTDIEPAATIIQDVVYYKVTFELEKAGDELRPGMSCDIDIHIAEKENVLSIPERSVREEGGKKYVQILTDAKNNLTSKVEVKTGLRGDGGLIEIVSGIKEGDNVVVSQTQK